MILMSQVNQMVKKEVTVGDQISLGECLHPLYFSLTCM